MHWKSRTWMSAFALLLLFSASALATAPYTYYQTRSRALLPMPYGPAAFPSATSALWTNPAGVGADGSSGFIFTKPASFDGYSDYMSDDLAWGINLGGLGFGVEYSNGDAEARRYTVALSDEVVDGLYFGTAYHWSVGLPLQNAWDAGLLARPWKWLSIGATATELIGGDFMGRDADPTYNVGVALRPWGSWLTLSGDVTFSKVGVTPIPVSGGMLPGGGVFTPNSTITGFVYEEVDYTEELNPTFTASVRPLDGLTLRAGYAVDSEVVFAGLSLSLGAMDIGGWGGTNNGDAITGMPEDAGVNWVRVSSNYTPTLFEPLMPKKIVKVKLNGRLVEEPEPFSFFHGSNPTVLEKIEQLDKIARDDRVAGVWLDLNGLSAQFADLEELRAAIQRLQDAGKKVVVYNDSFGFGQYYLASAADEIVMLPTGTMAIPGISFQTLHIRRLLDKIHVTPQVEKIGEYKSAGEFFTEDSLSAPAEENHQALLHDWWEEFTGKVAMGRGVDRSEVENWVGEVLHNGRRAMELGLVDTVAYDDEAGKYIRKAIAGDDKVNVVDLNTYLSMYPSDDEWEDMTSPKVAIIYAEGAIMTGNSGRSPWGFDPYVGSETVARAIRQARNDRRVKAIVFRVDSPGGSAEASDIIAREVKLTVDPKDDDAPRKPFIVSMSGVAGSGGYYIAAPADTILANKTTITGSIGVLAANLAWMELADSLGITFDPLTRGRNAAMFNGSEWNEEQRSIIRQEIEFTYDEFTSLVAEGRGMTVEEVDAVGRGRIFSGEDGIDKQLVDLEGGFYEAIQVAKQTIGYDPDEPIDLKLFTVDPMVGFGIDREVRAAAMSMMPESVKQMLIQEQALRELDARSMQMLAPIGNEDVYLD